MKYYVQFLTNSTKNETIEALGSDGVYILDGRNNLQNMIQDAHNQNNQLKMVCGYFTGFRIEKGNFKRSNTIYKEMF